jgi:hypothetical protein
MQLSYNVREIVLRGFTYKTRLLHLDDLIVVGRTLLEKFDNLRTFQTFEESQLKQNLEKCQLFQSPEGVTTDLEECTVVTTVEGQTLAEELPCTYYRRFTDGLADIPKPLT